MKKTFLSAMTMAVLVLGSCQKNLFRQSVQECNGTIQNNESHPMKDSIDAIVARYIGKGIPGIQVAVKNADGIYTRSGGYSSVEDRIPLQSCTPGWYFSLTKAYTASLVMKFMEKGRLDIDSMVTAYLPGDITSKISGIDQVTVRMLLNHSSGLINFTELPEYMVRQFNNPLKQPSLQEMLKMVEGKELLSEPGTKYFYSNTNYLLLYFLLENISGKSYGQLLQEEIIQPLQLQETFYGVSPEQAASFKFPNYYFDRHANDNLENVTLWNHHIAAASYGWGGIAGTPLDAIRFYEALMTGRVVSESSFQEMINWFQSKDATQPEYGLGIEYWQFAEGTTPQRGHEGDGIGNSTMLLYVPDNDTYLFINCTAGRKLPGPYLFKVTDFKNELGKYIAGWR